ncbi:M20/M25/M40 family metallo-hydrolase [Novosphingobium sp.]|uniref:M20/M25/M40 family metallo-hydrolase n=1 Tax=Novosphingobium sp. TaxID=1874826 RepID=UPI0025D8F235|nr:M20/M25/M40 family metallo-hydrolase [Novosphingobium sp.]MCC6926301.1 M20/M25/M40 family metallo-hydrolase [Novosphingobium sp.]
MRRTPLALAAVLALALSAPQLVARPAKPKGNPAAEAHALDLAKRLIAIRSVRGPGNQTDKAMRVVKGDLMQGGWADGDVEIVPVDDTAYLIATWPGSDPALKPLVISGHVDVVEARREDWQRDPFVPVVENGYLFGRGSQDMKVDVALATASLIALRKSGYKPRRTIVLQFSGDEETTMKTSRLIAQRLKNAELVVNVDGGGGTLDEANSKPLYWTWEGAEKTYDDYQLEVTNPGGHSSAPRPENAIVQLATAVGKVGAYRFKPEQNAITKAYFERAAQFEADPKTAAAMRAFAANPQDAEAAAVLRANPAYVGKVSTTCVATMVNGGHAQNALPQRATANINCRVFPGHSREEIRQELEQVIGMPVVKVTATSGEDSISSPASPMRPDFVAAAEKAVRLSYPGLPVIPSQASGASDSMWYRALGVPAYNASPLFSKDSEGFAHGLDERVPLLNFGPAVTYYLSLITDLSK